MYGYIYETTNLINGKKYIGKKTSAKFSINYLGSGIYLKRAIEKYGKENFKVKILEEVNTNQEDLCEREIYWINYYDAINSKDYYNIGAGGTGWNNSMNFKKGKDSPMFGKHHTKETKEKMSKLTKKRFTNIEERRKVSNRFKNKKLSEEHKRKISKSLKGKQIGKNNPMAVKCLLEHNNILKKFECIKDLQNYLINEYQLKLSGTAIFNLLDTETKYNPRCKKHSKAKGLVIKRIL